MFDEEIEKAMLYYLIFKQEEYLLDEDDFVSEKNKEIIKAINELKSEKQDITILNIKSKIKLNSGNVLGYLSSLGDYIQIENPDNIYNKLMELSRKRKTLKLIKNKMTEIEECENIDTLIQEVIQGLNKIEETGEKHKTFKEQVLEAIDKIEKHTLEETDYSLYTGIIDLDKMTCGLHEQELTIIGARPGIGKTTLALQIAQHIASKGVETAFISLEMSDYQIIQKMLSSKSKVNSYRMRLGTLQQEDFDKLASVTSDIMELPMHLISKIKTIQQIENMTRRLKNKNNLRLLVIDYLQLIKNKKHFNNREQEVAEITRTLKLLSIELNIPIIALCQLNRNATRQEPSLADLRESGAIEQDADNVLFLYQEKEKEDNKIDITLKIAKQRAGETGKIYLRFNKEMSEFNRGD